MSEQYQIGETVEWSSSAAGTTKQKRGVIVAVVPADYIKMTVLLLGADYASRYSIQFDGHTCLYRFKESYLVAVPTKSGRGKAKLYWPRTSALRKVQPDA